MAMEPTARDVHVDSLLTNISVHFMNTESYIADQIFPIVPVRKQSDLIRTYDKSHWFRDMAHLRSPGTESRGSGWSVGTANYYCPRYSFRAEIVDEVRDNSDDPINLDTEAVTFVMDKIQMRREVDFVGSFFTTGVWGPTAGSTDKTGGSSFTQWDDYANSQPLIDLTTWQEDVEGTLALTPRTLVLGSQVWSKLKWHPDLVDTIKYTQRGQVGVDLFAALAELDQVLLGRTIYTTSAEGTAESSVTYSRIWGKNALLLYRPASPGLMTPASGYTFVWQRVPNALQYMLRFRDEKREVDIIEGNTYYDQRLIVGEAGLFASGVIS